jgi:transcriptional regulator with XRE-family HTH domain
MPDQFTQVSNAKRDKLDAFALGQAVLLCRARTGMTQRALAAQSGLRRQYLGEVERGRVNPSFATLTDIANGLGTRLSTLIAEAEASTEGGSNLSCT